ncbi:similar to Saccharomyces cerevisiae YMR167W MLH1 Protein required for mismatch repair in mitosis and meiosis as well as crossing over during meiosis [Maudiozyma barnettii]|uniref:Similar to Saccharomyces cerevisiae YMR167W MLH1 Protein required for mismatch repair in mitosis and meiosis as well as crossing over during meiosis n=1 Tax=Maudiozyma barnettii TaxID=61262 RepID=A0A8H2VFG5_9SACH|nr:mismatch repair ATPase MLH1 [Kazachstania barnettii]CAB4254500.1 similar to Saccharomyces cerevisiae YMR167W MLH1 Protein required for mismatch repair in mitosis and meiosis as well as crossing over during meiosis [Kazachstania barnettii]CAD1782511.1 similar to Saccharomyces cerevisiae YMR167W MLH1 Protein required for mismatch repair in mitosis and meiosis as well as crossing over during meiosis [Kazachstania barnettii]
MTSSIRALDPSVVNKIAAGEIIISPVNALKEMMENSIDAKSTTIDILVKEGGIKLLQISDNGSGISKDDLPLLCERFTTSKLSTFEDLNEISTYGFRGEALASISHIAKITVTTKINNDKCAWRVSFAQGKMIDTPLPIAGTNGTTILVEDLFYNMPSRLRSLRSPNEEYNKILDVVGRYAIHSSKIGFSCKKFGDSQFSLSIRATLDTKDRIRAVYNGSVASNLINFVVDENEGLPLDKLTGYISNMNYISKKAISPIFFINNRLVTCDPLRRILNQTYMNFLPKGNKPFIYLSLMIEPTSVDVNVHPTKREVRFLKQDEIIEQISLKVNEELSKVDTTRTFKASSILTGSQSIGQTSAVIRSKSLYRQSNSQVNADSSNLSQTTPNKVRKYENKMVRTDASQAKITSFLKSSQYVEGNSLNKDNNNEVLNLEEDTEEEQNNNISSPSPTVDDTSNKLIELPNEETNILDKSSQVKQTGHNFNYVVIKNKRSMVNLSSIKELREAEDNRAHKELTNIFANLNYVGIVDTERRLISIQHDLKLFLVDYGSICNELFYQIGLTDFSNFGRISLLTENNENLKLVNLLSVFEDLPKQKVRDIVSSLWQMKEMLDEYFSITLKTDDDSENLNQVQLQSIPLLLKGYNPSLDKLPLFIRRLGTKVNWENEIDCLNAILKEIALLYVPPIIKTIDQNDGNLCDEQKIAFVNKSELLETTLENIVFPTIKRRFLATNNLVKDVVEIANLPGLYKVFERC